VSSASTNGFTASNRTYTFSDVPILRKVFLVWEPSMGTCNKPATCNKLVSKQNNSINRITVVTNNRNNTGIVASGFYTWVRLKASTELHEEYATVSEGFIGLQPAQPVQPTLWLQMATSRINSLYGFIGLH
jgi:hypothetical protein